MERLSSYEADRLNDALYGMDKDGAAQAQVSARYVRTDKDGTPWVRFEGADKDTPLTSAMSVRAREGDIIDVSLGGYEAVGGGNRTDPSAGFQDVRAVTVEVEHVKGKQAEFEKVTAQELEAEKARIGQLEADSAEIEELVAQKATIAELEAAEGRITSLESDHVSTTDLQAVNGEITNLKAKDATIEGNITAATGRIGTIEADYLKAADMTAEQARVNNLLAGKATVNDLNAATGRITVLESTKANIADIEANYITADDIEATYMHADMTNSDVAWIQNGVIANGAISSAMINDVSANKLTAGTINGSVINVTNLNADNITTGTINGQRIGEGSLSLDKLSDDVYTEAEVDAKLATMQAEIDGAIETWTGTEVPTLSNAPASNWSDAATRDTHVGDVYFVVNSQSQQNGYNYRFTKSGSTYSWQLIKDSDVTNALQRISAAEGKITQFDSDISTLKTDTGTLTTRTTSLETRADGVDSALLDKVDTTDFNELSDTVDGHTQTLSQHTTAISNKADGSTVNALTTRVSKNEQDISGINTTIGELQTTVASKADGSDLTTVSNRLNTVSDTVDGHTQTISSVQSTLATKADGSTVETLTTRVSDVEQDVSGFKQTVSETYATKGEAKQTDSDSGKRVIVTEDAAELPLLALTAYGECSQDGTPTPDAPVPIKAVRGRNLLDAAGNLAAVSGGLDKTASDDGKIRIAGTATAGWAYITQIISVNLPAGVYTLSLSKTMPYRVYAAITYADGTTFNALINAGNAVRTWTADKGIASLRIIASVMTSGTTYDDTVGIQLEAGSTPTPYVPYGHVGLEVQGRNLLENTATTTTVSGVTFTVNEDKSVTANGTATAGIAFPIDVVNMPDGNYVLSGCPANGSASTYRLSLAYHGYEYGAGLAVTGPVVNRAMTIAIANGYTCENLTFYPQLELGTTATDYEPYRESVAYIDLKGEELCSLPDGTQDVLTVDASGHVLLEKRTKKVVWDDVVNFSSNSTRINASTNANTDVVVPAASEMPVLLATHLVPRIWSGATVPGTSFINPSNGAIGWNFSPGVASTLAELKTLYPGAYSIHLLKEPRTIDLGYIDPPTTFDGGTVHVDAEIQPVIDASWWTSAGYEAGKAYNDGNNQADLNALEQRVTTAESSITQQAGQIALKANASDVYTKQESTALLEVKANKATLTSEINASADTVKIDAARVNIEGAAIFTSGRLSQSSLDGAYDASGAASGAVSALTTDLASSTGTTVINGGHIETGSLTIGQVSNLQSTLNGKADDADVTQTLADAKDYADEAVDNAESGLDERLVSLENNDAGYVDATFVPDEIPVANIHGQLTVDKIDVDSLRAALLQVASLLVGSNEGFHIEASGSRMSFKDGGGNEVAYIDVDPNTNEAVFYMTRSIVAKDMQFGEGKWKWYKRDNGNMSLKWMGGM